MPSDKKVHPEPGTGRLTYRQLSHGFQEAFAAFDEDGDGTVDVSEMARAAKAYKDFRTAKGTYSLHSFPADLQEELKVFDKDCDGTVSSEELARACLLYRNSKRQTAKAIKGALFLAGLVLLLLAANCGLVFAVVYLTKDTTVGGDGVMTVKNDRDQPVSVGSISQVVSVNADSKAWSKLRNNTFDAFAMKPDAIGVTLGDNSVFNFPVEWFEVTEAEAKLGNSALGYTVIISNSSGVDVLYPSNNEFALKEAQVTKVRVFIRPGHNMHSDEDAENAIKGDLGHTRSRSASSAQTAQSLVSDLLARVPVFDLNENGLRNPVQLAAGGDEREWFFKVDKELGVPAMRECCVVIERHGGQCVGAERDYPSAMTIGNLRVNISRGELNELLADEAFRLHDNACGCSEVRKIVRTGTPSYKIMHPRHADPHQHTRHQDIRRMALSTFKGHKVKREIERRAEAEGWYDAERANRRRRLKEVAVGDSLVDAVLENFEEADCYVGNNVPYL